jgi:hypothetical protein
MFYSLLFIEHPCNSVPSYNDWNDVKKQKNNYDRDKSIADAPFRQPFSKQDGKIP